ncbi:MAG: hypothetical protein IJU57_03285, partial [Clostridia bacterium]|nr:hypothetical protein [Clostridia bacterium]
MKGKNGTSRARRRLGAVMTASLLSLSMVFGSVPGTVLAADGDSSLQSADETTVGGMDGQMSAGVHETDYENNGCGEEGFLSHEAANVVRDALDASGIYPEGTWSVNTTEETDGFYISTYSGADLKAYVRDGNASGSSQTATFSDTEDGSFKVNTIKTGGVNGTVDKEGIVNTSLDVNQGKASHLRYKASGKGTATFYYKTQSAKAFAVNRVESGSEVTVLGYLSTDDAGKIKDSTPMTVGSLVFMNSSVGSLTRVTFPITKNTEYILGLGGSKIEASGIIESLAAVLTGTIDLGGNTLPAGWGLRFTNLKDGSRVEAEIDKTRQTYTAELEEGEYKASLVDAYGYSVSDDTRTFTFNSIQKTHDISIVNTPQYTLSGNIVSSDDLTKYSHLDDVEISFIPEDTETFETVQADFDPKTLEWSAVLICDEKYTLSLEGAWDYALEGDTTVPAVTSIDDRTRDLSLVKHPVYPVTGGFIGLTQVRGEYEDLNVTPSAIRFTDVEETHVNYVYEGTISDAAYSVSLRDGSYIASVDLEGYSTTTHVVVDGGKVERNILLKDERSVEVPYSGVLRVGAKQEFKTVQAAVDAVARMNRESGQRVTIIVSPGTYREQVIINSPDISLVSESGRRDNTKITWYYGIGYAYYSAVNESFGGRNLTMYSPYADYDQFERGNVINNWGSCVVTTKYAEGFRAQNITFENSFNKYMTDEEIADGVIPSGLEQISLQRNKNTTVNSKAATERAAAFMNYADKVEYMNCGFISSQDTLYTGNGNFDVYYRNCYIEGSTDFICGEGNVIFDACELNICGYFEKESPAYITANSSSATSRTAGTKGYIFRSCFISA